MDSERPPRVLWAILALTVVVGVGMAAPVSLPSDNAMLPDAGGSATQTATATGSTTPSESVVVGDSETFAVEPTGDEGTFDYRFTVDGEVAPAATDDGDLEGTDRIVRHDNGTVTVVGVADAPAGDTYDVDGELLSFERPATRSADQSDVRLSVDDTDVTVTVIQDVAVEQTDTATGGESPTPDTETESSGTETPDTETESSDTPTRDTETESSDTETRDTETPTPDTETPPPTSDTEPPTSDTGPSTSDDGTEANHDFDTARSIEPGTYDQVEAGDGERDYYAIDIDEGEVINAWLPGPRPTARLWVYGPDREQIQRTMITSGDTWLSTPPLRAGTYYLVAEPGSDAYSVGLSTTPDDDRFEPNNDPDGATRIDPGRYENLRITAGEVDTFAVDAEEGQRVRVSIAFDHDTGNLDLTHYFDSDYVGSFSETDGESLTHELRGPGPFVFQVVGTDGASAPYSLDVTVVDESSGTTSAAETVTSTATETQTTTETESQTISTSETQTTAEADSQTTTATETRTTGATPTRSTTEPPTTTPTATETPTTTTTGTEPATPTATATGGTSTDGG